MRGVKTNRSVSGRRMWTVAAALSVAALLGAACGSSDDDEQQAATETTAANDSSAGANDATDAESDSAAAAAAESGADVTAEQMKAVIDGIDWPDNVEVTIGTDTWTFRSNGRPDHELPAQYLVPKPGVDARTATLDILQVSSTPDREVDVTYELPLAPKQNASATNLFGILGVIRSGGVVNDPYEADQKTIAVEATDLKIGDVTFIDSCSAHFNPMGYHYHGIPYCMTEVLDSPGQHSALRGFMVDGFPVYGPQGDDGAEETDLDECRGHFGPTPEFPDGIYHYHLTSTFPYTTLCLMGTPEDSSMQMPDMGGQTAP